MRSLAIGLIATMSFGGLSFAQEKKAEIKNSIGMKLAYIPAGKFKMGSPKSEQDDLRKRYGDEVGRHVDRETQHEVEITKGYYIGVCEVTVGQFEKFVAATNYRPSSDQGKGGTGYNQSSKWFEVEGKQYTWRSPGVKQGPDHPVVNVGYDEAIAFCAWLTKREGKKYNLPTEAQWEYACRAGTKSRYSCGEDDGDLRDSANIADLSLKPFLDPEQIKNWGFAPWDDGHPFAAPVGSFKANAFDLRDMHGNVREWCRDWYKHDEYERGNCKDPAGPLQGSSRCVRGGSWNRGPYSCRSAYRDEMDALYITFDVGFRVCMEPKVKK